LSLEVSFGGLLKQFVARNLLVSKISFDELPPYVADITMIPALGIFEIGVVPKIQVGISLPISTGNNFTIQGVFIL
jgi:hypothetical protein